MGRACAERLAAEGARVAVLARSHDMALAAALREAGATDSPGLVADIADSAAVDAAFAAVGEQWGELNTLVVAAGPPTQRVRWFEASDADWQQTYDVGALGPVRCVRAALPLLREAAWARVVVLGAMSSRIPGPERTAYSSTKAALATACKSISIDLAPEQILVNVVAPGAVFTDQLRAKRDREAPEVPDDPAALMDWIATRGFRAQTGRIGLPQEIADAVAFLGSRANGYITGAHLNVDGGSAFL